MTFRGRHLRLLLPVVALSCASPSPHAPYSDALALEAFRLYGNGDCESMQDLIRRIDFSGVGFERTAQIALLQAYCSELAGELLSAKDRYAALIAQAPRSVPAIEAAIRLHEIEMLQKHGLTREQLSDRVSQERQSPRYQHGLQAKHRTVPVYPPGAQAAGIEGWVEVDFAISRDGAVVDPRVLASQPRFLFDGAALAAIRNWSYPALEGSEPIRSIVRINFEIEQPRPGLSSVRVAAREDASGFDPVERRGRAIFEDDLATDRAGDAVLREGYFTSLWNWIVVRQANGLLVRYIDDDDRVFADVLVDVFSSDLERVTIHDTPVALPADQLEMWKARVAAVALARRQRLFNCSDHYSLVVLPSIEPRDSFDIYLLPDSKDPGAVPVGGIYRIEVSKDPAIAPEAHAFADSCAYQKASVDSGMVMIRDTTSTAPTEVHVFLNLRYGYPLGVVVNDEKNGLWFVEHGRMRRATSEPPGSASQ